MNADVSDELVHPGTSPYLREIMGGSPNARTNFGQRTVPLMTVGTLPVTKACSKPSCYRLPGCVQVVKAGGRRVFVVEIGHFYMKKIGVISNF